MAAASSAPPTWRSDSRAYGSPTSFGSNSRVWTSPPRSSLTRVGPIVEKKKRLGADSWGTTDAGVRQIIGPLEELFEKEFPNYQPFPFGAPRQIAQLVRHMLISEALLDEWAERFRGVTAEDVDRLMRSFQFESCCERKELAQLRSRIGYVFQNGALFDSMNVFENVRLGITDEDKFRDEDYARERVAGCLKLVNLSPEVMEKYPAELSGGMRKRVGIARAIAGSPKYLLYDEPTSGLDGRSS